MSEFNELIKNFDKIRNYIRDFYIYGFMVRGDYQYKSARTYDNEKRRIESWLGNFMTWRNTERGKTVSISLDSRKVRQNPLYAAWKSKSFTDNDIMLHFFLLNILKEGSYTAQELTEKIGSTYHVIFDTQTVRNKANEYVREGLLEASKQGKKIYFRKKEQKLWQHPVFQKILDAIKYYEEVLPFGFVGNTILQEADAENDLFYFKHCYFVHSLEDKVLMDLLTCIREKKAVVFEYFSRRSKMESTLLVIPFQIQISTQSGRRFVTVMNAKTRRLCNVRLDGILKVDIRDKVEQYDRLYEKYQHAVKKCWGVSYGEKDNPRMQQIFVKLRIDEEKEPYILERIKREGRGGELQKIREHEYLYSNEVHDVNEVLGFVKSLTGRVIAVESTYEFVTGKFYHDMERMFQMYLD